LPEDVDLYYAEWDFDYNCMTVYLEKPDFPELPFGCVVPYVSPTARHEFDEDGRQIGVIWEWSL
jgi:hypothetical protein